MGGRGVYIYLLCTAFERHVYTHDQQRISNMARSPLLKSLFYDVVLVMRLGECCIILRRSLSPKAD